ncbi:hypothetical protein GQ53DRAFT_405983 [Thozetella sp. PMI_491]|nr:hypothetical protein GQ53DRAFT_405983 [Thozetella sp. PMI_491]
MKRRYSGWVTPSCHTRLGLVVAIATKCCCEILATGAERGGRGCLYPHTLARLDRIGRVKSCRVAKVIEVKFQRRRGKNSDYTRRLRRLLSHTRRRGRSSRPGETNQVRGGRWGDAGGPGHPQQQRTNPGPREIGRTAKRLRAGRDIGRGQAGTLEQGREPGRLGEWPRGKRVRAGTSWSSGVAPRNVLLW